MKTNNGSKKIQPNPRVINAVMGATLITCLSLFAVLTVQALIQSAWIQALNHFTATLMATMAFLLWRAVVILLKERVREQREATELVEALQKKEAESRVLLRALKAIDKEVLAKSGITISFTPNKVVH